MLLREVEKRTGIVERFAACFRDHREAERVEHTVQELVAQRVYGLALGYEDLNDHDELRVDLLLAVLVEKGESDGRDRVRGADRGKALAGKSTLNRLELTKEKVEGERERYKKIAVDQAAVDRLLVAVFLHSYAEAPQEIVLNIDAHRRSSVSGDRKGGSSWLLRGLLLSATVYFLRPGAVVRTCGYGISTPRRGGWRNCSGS